MTHQGEYIYRGVAGFQAEGFGGRSDLATPRFGNIEAVKNYINNYFYSVPTTWYINRHNDAVSGAPTNVEKFTVTPRGAETDIYALVTAPSERFIALGKSVQGLKDDLAAAGDETVKEGERLFKIYRGEEYPMSLNSMELIDSFTWDDLATQRQLTQVEDEEMIRQLESRGYIVTRK